MLFIYLIDKFNLRQQQFTNVFMIGVEKGVDFCFYHGHLLR